MEVLTAVDKLVLGHVIFELDSHSGLVEQASVQALLASGEFPRLAQVAAAARTAAATADDFERGLAWLLNGIEAQFKI